MSISAPFFARILTDSSVALAPRSYDFLWLAVTVLVLLLILWLLVSLRRRSKPLEVFTNTAGRVQVSRGALGDLVESAAVQYGVASRPRVDFKIRSGQVHLYIRLKLATGQRLPEFSNGLQNHLTTTLRDSFGLDKLAGVHLTVTGFKGRALPVTDDEPKPLTRLPTPSTPPAASKPRPPGDNFFST